MNAHSPGTPSAPPPANAVTPFASDTCGAEVPLSIPGMDGPFRWEAAEACGAYSTPRPAGQAERRSPPERGIEPGTPPQPSPPSDAGRVLLPLARAAIARRLGRVAPPVDTSPAWLDVPTACFVTLTLGSELRGCVGSLTPTRSLKDAVAHNACAAAFEDHRFPPLTDPELDRVDLEVSVLSPLEPMSATSEADVVQRLRPGSDGLVFEAAGRRSTFLPQVWQVFPDPREFLGRLRTKGGLAADYWGSDVRLSRYTVRVWQER